MDEKKLLKELQKSLELELWAVTLYSDYINRVSDERARAFFVAMAEASEEHAMQFRKEIYKLRLKQKITKPLPVSDALRLTKKGLNEEKAMLSQYQKLAMQVSSPELKKLLEKISKAEEGHAKATVSLIEYLKKQA